MKKILIIVIIVIAALASTAIAGYSALKSNAVAKESSVYLHQETDYELLLQILEEDGVIKNIKRFNRFAKMLDLDKTGPKPGHYFLKQGTSYLQAVRTFQRGLQTPVRITFNHIRILPQLAGRISPQIEADSTSLANFLLSDTTASHYGFTNETFISMFIPNTYEMYWTTSPAGFADRMKTEYDRFWTPEREQKLSSTGLTKTEAITLASIVYEETKQSDEMPRVAGVYINRLKKGQKLQADPTVKFAVGDFTLKRILYKHLDVESPYNTYLNHGLPPGPIAMPSVTAIDAVLNYEHHNYIFFCARPDFSGYHNFAVTNAEHERNRRAWIEAINKAGIR